MRNLIDYLDDKIWGSLDRFKYKIEEKTHDFRVKYKIPIHWGEFDS